MGQDDVVIRQRADGATELRVNGVFVMDDVETSSEQILAEHVLAGSALETGASETRAREILVGGLGLGYTARALLDGGAERVLVVELHAAVVDAVAAGTGAGPLDDPRLSITVGDVADVISDLPAASLDAICLDVDNGPDFLVHPSNAGLYDEPTIARCAAALRPGGTLAIWSMADSPALRAVLGRHLAGVSAVAVPVLLQGRDETYWILSGTRPPD